MRGSNLHTLLLPPTIQIAGEEAIGRYLQLVGKAWQNFERLAAEKPSVRHVGDGGGKFRAKVAAAPPPRALKPRRAGIVNIRRAR